METVLMKGATARRLESLAGSLRCLEGDSCASLSGKVRGLAGASKSHLSHKPPDCVKGGGTPRPIRARRWGPLAHFDTKRNKNASVEKVPGK